MAKVYLSPAMHKWNPCAIAGMDETTENNMYIDELTPFLDACGIQWKRGVRRTPKSDESGDKIMWQNIRESNAWGADIHYISHTNAANGQVKGYRPIIYPTNNAKGEKLAAILVAKRNEIYPFGSQLNRRSDLAELSETKATAYYEEHVFHDNLEDDTWFHNNMRNIARQTAKGFCEYFGIAFKDPYEGGDVKPATQPQPQPQSQQTAGGDVYYAVYAGGRWLPEVKNHDDYAGLKGVPIQALKMRLSSGDVKYRAHIIGGKIGGRKYRPQWLPWVKNHEDYAGIYGLNIDMIQASASGKRIIYRTECVGSGNYLPEVEGYNNSDVNGYAGIGGKPIDKFQARIV